MLLFEDDFLLAVNKPNNVLVHHSKMANNKHEEKSLVQLLKDTHQIKAYPIHRLDRKTSGIVLFTKKKGDVSKFQDLFEEQTIQKNYYAIVRGFTPAKGIIDSNVKGRDALVYKTALTEYKRENQIELPIPVIPYQTSRYSLLKLTPKTGRLHQLRIHMNKISHPIIGDPKYGDRFHNRMFEEKFNNSSIYLHAKQIEFKHPITNIKIIINCPWTKEWIEILEKFNWN